MTRTKLQLTTYFLAELKNSIKDNHYATKYGYNKLLGISDMLVEKTYEVVRDRDEAEPIWDSIVKIVEQYDGRFAEEVKENVFNLNSRV